MIQQEQHKQELQNTYLNIDEISILKGIQEEKQGFNTNTPQDNLNLIEGF